MNFPNHTVEAKEFELVEETKKVDIFHQHVKVDLQGRLPRFW